MLFSCRRTARNACTLSALRWGSSSCSSTSNPGASLTNVAESSPPRRTVAPSASACPAILILIIGLPRSISPRRLGSVCSDGSPLPRGGFVLRNTFAGQPPQAILRRRNHLPDKTPCPHLTKPHHVRRSRGRPRWPLHSSG